VNQPLVPASTAPGGRTFTLTVSGTGFTPSSIVKWNGASLVTKFVSSNRLKARVPASKIAKMSTASVTVANPGVARSDVVFFPIAPPEVSLGFTQSMLSSGSFPVAGDFNKDGKLDLAISVPGTSVSVLLGKGDGTFAVPITNAGCLAQQMVVADLNGDGRLDLTNLESDTSEVCLGHGDGTLAGRPAFYIGDHLQVPERLVTGDFNANGTLDVGMVVDAAGLGSSFFVFLGTGDGTFQNAGSFLFSPLVASGAVVGDFNRDGRLDLAAPERYTNTVAVLLGNGDGTFQDPTYYAAGTAPSALVSADFNGDNKLDLALTNVDPDGIAVLLGNGDGTFRSPVNYSTGNRPVQIALGDLNGDGNLDLAVTGSPAVVSVLLGNGDGSFQQHIDFATGSDPIDVPIGDFNRDGRLDLAIDGGGNVSLLLQ
jgi:hypothetical protein